ncbi:MAG: glycosyltransferase [Candidatus Nealsonbacteria bacterium]|nr:glycosyltransferase [Candidatus Nealsonbacteria bacterium]
MFKKNPETSIIIRTFNEEKHIGNLLKAIKEQEYKNYEIILVDSGSTDNTLKIARGLGCRQVLKIESHNFTFGYSLNIGCQKAKGKYLVFVSAHVVPANNQWLGRILEPFQNEKVSLVYGKQVGSETSKFSEKRDFERIFGNSALYPNNANAAIRRDLWQKNHFDEYLFGLEDIEWAKRMKDLGFLAYYEPKAAILHIHNEKWHQIFNRYRREAIAAARIGLSSPPQASYGFLGFARRFSQDLLASFPNFSPDRLGEIARFRYYQWKGTRQGWRNDRYLDFNRDKYDIFYPAANKAVVIKNKQRAVFEEMPLPKTNPGDILIQVDYVGICRTDLEIYDGSLGYYKNGQAAYPIIPGHEFSGTIIKIGANNRCRELFKVGDKVVGECILSRDDKKRKEVGVINYNGAYSQFIVMPGIHLHKIPKTLDLKTACLAEPLAVVLRALRRIKSRLKADGNFAVIGAGPIGNLCSQVLSNAGFCVTVFDKNKKRLDILKNKTKAVSQNMENLEKFDVIIEATGSKEVLEKILKESKSDAAILLLGFPYGSITYNFEDIPGKEKFIAGSVGGDKEDFDEALNFLPKIDTAAFTEKVMPLESFSEAWQLQRSSKCLKILLKVKKDNYEI